MLRYMNVKKLDPYVINNTHIDCDRYTYDALNDTIVKSLNDEMKIIMNETVFFYNYVE